ncbi:MAG: hypothetical protein FWD15_05120 [Alphaproteobacteria bacterium]|nr:hypothetical protein [Alphaproteobacteria bacterium]
MIGITLTRRIDRCDLLTDEVIKPRYGDWFTELSASGIMVCCIKEEGRSNPGERAYYASVGDVNLDISEMEAMFHIVADRYLYQCRRRQALRDAAHNKAVFMQNLIEMIKPKLGKALNA